MTSYFGGEKGLLVYLGFFAHPKFSGVLGGQELQDGPPGDENAELWTSRCQLSVLYFSFEISLFGCCLPSSTEPFQSSVEKNKMYNHHSIYLLIVCLQKGPHQVM